MKHLHFITKALSIIAFLFVWVGCSEDPVLEQEEILSPSEFVVQDKLNIETVPLETSLQYLRAVQSRRSTNPISLDLDLESIRYEPMTDTDVQLTVIDATTHFDNVDSRVLQLMIDGEMQTVLFNMIPEDPDNTTRTANPAEFNGIISITNLDGIVHNNFQVNSGVMTGIFNFNFNSNATDPDPPCWGIACGIQLEEVVVTPPSNIVSINQFHFGALDPNYPKWRYNNNSYWGYATGYMHYYRQKELEKWRNLDFESEGEKIDPEEETRCFDLNQGGKLTVYVQQPTENSYNLIGENQVGHVFVALEQNGRRRLFGFYPPPGVNASNYEVGTDYVSELRDNSGTLYHVSISTNITATQMQNIVSYVQNHPPVYNLKSYACADFGIAIGNLGGLNLPSTTVRDWTGYFEGRSPAELGQEIRAMNSDAAKSSTATARSLGVAGERAVGIGSKTRIPSLSGTAKYRIPDGLTSTTLTEVKNVAHQSLTRQLRDFHMFSQQTGRQFILYTRPTTTFSRPLQNLINQGQIIVKPIPGL